MPLPVPGGELGASKYSPFLSYYSAVALFNFVQKTHNLILYKKLGGCISPSVPGVELLGSKDYHV